MIKYGTSYLPCYNGDTEDWLERFIDPRDIWPVDLTTRNHSLHHLGVPTPPPMPPPRVAVVHWPTCAQAFGFVHFVATDDQIESYRTLKTNTGDYLELTDGLGGTPVKPFMYLLPPRPLSYIDGHKRMWLCTFVDARYFWWFGDREVNIDYPDPCEGEESTTTWGDLFDAIADNLNITITVDPVHSFYGRPSNRFEVKNQPMPVLLDAAARAVGMRFCAAIDGTYRVWNFVQANATDTGSAVLALESRRVAGYTLDNQAAFIPTAYTTSFGRVTCGSGCKVYDAEPYQKTVELDELVDILPAYTGYEANLFPGEFHYVGDMDAIIGSGGITNESTLQDYAEKSAYDWWSWQVLGADRVYAGTADYPLNPAVEVAEWYYRRDKCVTRVTKHRTNDRSLGMYRMSSDPGYLSVYRSSLDACNLGSGGSIPQPPTPTTDCSACGWLLYVPTDKTLILNIPRATGLCSCIPVEQGDNPDEGIRFIMVHDGTKWVGWKMFETCCSCGNIELVLNDAGTSPLDEIPEFDLHIKAACTDGNAFDYRLSLECCPSPGVAIFAASGTKLCNFASGVDDDCDQYFQVRIECGECDLSNRICDGCFSGTGPPVYFIHIEGFTGGNEVYNGDWYLNQDECGCVWKVECGEIILTFTVILDTVDPATSHAELDLTGGGSDLHYEFDPNDPPDPENPQLIKCFEDIVVTDEGGEVETLTVSPLFCNNLPGCCDPADIPSSVTLSVPCLGISVEIPRTLNDPDHFNFILSTTDFIWCNYPTIIGPPPEPPVEVPQPISISIVCTVVDGVRVYAMDITSGSGASASVEAVLNGGCDPFYILFDLSYTECPQDGGESGNCIAAIYENGFNPSWCVDGVCVESIEQPEGGIGPFFGNCEDACNCAAPEAMMMISSARQTGGFITDIQGPGTELKNILAEIGLSQSEGCPCKSREKKMNRWGLEKCKEKRGEIEQWLREDSTKVGWGTKMKASLRAVATGIAFKVNPIDPAPGLLDLALSRWQEKLDSFVG